MAKLGVIGVGAMGGAIVRGLLSSGKMQAAEILAFNRTRERLRSLEEEFSLPHSPGCRYRS